MKFRRPYVEEDHKAVEHNGGDTDDGVEDEDHGDHEEGRLVEPGPGTRHNLQHRSRYTETSCSIIQKQSVENFDFL